MKYLLLWITIIALLALVIESAPFDEKQVENISNCRKLCSQCGCVGFHCGEECICECNKENTNSGGDCITKIQENARTLNTPFEILIQGPTRNSLMKEAKKSETADNQQACSAQVPVEKPNKRSTVTIYKPAVLKNSLIQQYKEEKLTPSNGKMKRFTKIEELSSKSQNLPHHEIRKRSIDKLFAEQSPLNPKQFFDSMKNLADGTNYDTFVDEMGARFREARSKGAELISKITTPELMPAKRFWTGFFSQANNQDQYNQ